VTAGADAGVLRDRLARALHPLDPVPALAPWNAGDVDDLLDRPLRRAAVLVALIHRPEGTQLLLTRRHEDLRTHAGQVSFPGGGIEAVDAGPIAAALREAEEEVGLPPERTRPLGLLDPLVTVSAFHVWPVVAEVYGPFRPRPDPREVAEVFEVPLRFLMDPGNCRRVEADWRGRRRHWFEYRFGPHRIWGVTAAILVNLRERLERHPGGLP